MSKFQDPYEQAIRNEKRKKQKIESEKIKLSKRRMEIIRTSCAVIALLMNTLILLHILGVW